MYTLSFDPDGRENMQFIWVCINTATFIVSLLSPVTCASVVSLQRMTALAVILTNAYTARFRSQPGA
jgi:hypothetical protein